MLSRILRNNDFIRIFAICQICILIFSVNVFASASTQDVNQVIQRTNNFTVWTDYTQNFNIYYGSEESDYLETLVYSLADFIQKSNKGASYNIPQIYNTTPDLHTNKYISDYLKDITLNQFYAYKQDYQNITNIRSDINTVNSYLYGIKNNLDTNIVDIENALLNFEKIDWTNTNIKSIRSFGTSISNQNIQPADNTALGPGTYYARLSEFTYSYIQSGRPSSVWRFDIPFRASSLNRVNDLLTSIELVQSDGTPLNARVFYTWEYSGNFYTPRVYVYDFRMPHSYPDSLYLKIVFANNFFYRNDNLYAYYLPDDTLDSYLVSYFGLLEEIKNKDFVANIDGSDIEVNINDSINVTPIELDVQIGIDDFTAVNTVSNKLRSWLSTGVGVVDLIAALDELDDTFFTLHNRSVIETISTGYTDYYD